MTEQGKKVWKELKNIGWSNEPKDFHLEYFEDIIEATKKALTLTDVIVSSCCKGTGFIELPNGEDCYCCCEIGKKQRSQQYEL